MIPDILNCKNEDLNKNLNINSSNSKSNKKIKEINNVNNIYLREELNKEIMDNAVWRKNKINNKKNFDKSIIKRTLTSLCENDYEYNEYSSNNLNRINSFIVEKSNSILFYFYNKIINI